MGAVTQVLRGVGSKADKLYKRVLQGKEGSPFKNVDDLGSFPSYRNIKDLPGTEKKKLKKIGEKISKEFRKKDRELRNKASKEMFKSAENKAMGGRVGYKSGMGVCKLAKRGKGRAYGKNS